MKIDQHSLKNTSSLLGYDELELVGQVKRHTGGTVLTLALQKHLTSFSNHNIL